MFGNPSVPCVRCHSSTSASYWHTPVSVLARWGIKDSFSRSWALVSCMRANGVPLVLNPPRIGTVVMGLFIVGFGVNGDGYMLPVPFTGIAARLSDVSVRGDVRYGLGRWARALVDICENWCCSEDIAGILCAFNRAMSTSLARSLSKSSRPLLILTLGTLCTSSTNSSQLL